MAGKGTDEVGDFLIIGMVTDDTAVEFIKQYIGKHKVIYKGTLNKERNQVKGRWEIPDNCSGEFELNLQAVTQQWNNENEFNNKSYESLLALLIIY